MSVLASTLLGAVSELRKGKVVVIPSSLDVHEAAGILSSHVISSAPVVHEDSGEFLGMFDFMDLIALVLAAFQKDSLAEIDLTDKALDLAKFLNDMANVSHVTHAPIASVVDLSKHKPTPVMKHSESLAKVFQLFSSGTKRVLVTGEKAQEIVGIFSQSDAVKFVDKNKSSFGSVLSKTIDELKIAEKEVMTVLDSASVLDALQVMFRNNISGVAIVTKTGRMVGSISMTDLKHAFALNWIQVLLEPCHAYIASVRRETMLREVAARDSSPVISVKKSHRLGDVISLFTATRVHRVWIIDEAGRPKGVISLTDVIRTLSTALELSP